jgi:hypothetical protein
MACPSECCKNWKFYTKITRLQSSLIKEKEKEEQPKPTTKTT